MDKVDENKLLLTVEEASKICSIGRTKMYELLKKDDMRPVQVKLGTKILIRKKTLEEYLMTHDSI